MGYIGQKHVKDFRQLAPPTPCVCFTSAWRFGHGYRQGGIMVLGVAAHSTAYLHHFPSHFFSPPPAFSISHSGRRWRADHSVWWGSTVPLLLQHAAGLVKREGEQGRERELSLPLSDICTPSGSRTEEERESAKGKGNDIFCRFKSLWNWELRR